ncbi:hypothetical protein HWV62_36547 [Athelia sp. TMB]|nr:hypothetical protein HWV62_36547 [Athelia sp. TMB]
MGRRRMGRLDGGWAVFMGLRCGAGAEAQWRLNHASVGRAARSAAGSGPRDDAGPGRHEALSRNRPTHLPFCPPHSLSQPASNAQRQTSSDRAAMSIAQRRPAPAPPIDTQRRPHISAAYRTHTAPASVPAPQQQRRPQTSSAHTSPSPSPTSARPGLARHASSAGPRSPQAGAGLHRIAASAPHSPVSRSPPLPAVCPSFSLCEMRLTAISRQTRHAGKAGEDAPIAMDIFAQILELDDDAAHECSRALVAAFFEQAREAHRDMLRAYAANAPAEVAALGHFLKGSASALGVQRLGATCQDIEHHGQLAAAAASPASSGEAMARIGRLLGRVEGECVAAERWLGRWYAEEG